MVLAGRQHARVGFRRSDGAALGCGDRRAPADARGQSPLIRLSFSRNGECLETDRGLLSITIDPDAPSSSGDQKLARGFLFVDDWVTRNGKSVLWREEHKEACNQEARSCGAGDCTPRRVQHRLFRARRIWLVSSEGLLCMLVLKQPGSHLWCGRPLGLVVGQATRTMQTTRHLQAHQGCTGFPGSPSSLSEVVR